VSSVFRWTRRRAGGAGLCPAGAPARVQLWAARKEGARGGTTGSPTSNALPILVFEVADGNIRRVAAGERVGTIITTEQAQA
jgi:hypothetical protein